VEPCRKEFRPILGTESGKLLQFLESSPVFMDIFFLRSTGQSFEPSDQLSYFTDPQQSVNPFFLTLEDEESFPCDQSEPNPSLAGLNNEPEIRTPRKRSNSISSIVSRRTLGGEKERPEGEEREREREREREVDKEREKEEKPVTRSQIIFCLQQPRSGIEEIFRKRKDILNDFVDLHGWLYEIASLILVFEQSRKLAGVGGNLLVYGLANSTLNHLLTFMETLLQKAKNCADKLFEVGNGEKLSLLRQNGVRTLWMNNFTYACSYKDGLIRSINACVEASGEVRLQVSCFYL